MSHNTLHKITVELTKAEARAALSAFRETLNQTSEEEQIGIFGHTQSAIAAYRALAKIEAALYPLRPEGVLINSSEKSEIAAIFREE